MRGIRKTQDRGRALRTLVRTRRRLAAAALAVALGRAGLATNISLLARGDDSALSAGIETVRAALEAGESAPLGEGVAFYTTDEAFADAASAASDLRKTPFYQGWALLAP